MLQERLEKLNQLRKQAMGNPDFVASAKAHEEAIHEQEHQRRSTKSEKNSQPKRLSDIFKEIEFGADSHH